MKTLKEIKDEFAQECGWENWQSCYGEEVMTNYVINEVAKRYAKEVAMQALKNASENAGTKRDQSPML